MRFLPLVNNQLLRTVIEKSPQLVFNEGFDAEVSWKSLWNCCISKQRLFTKLMNLCSQIAHLHRVLRSRALHDIYMFSLLESRLGSDLHLSAAAAACQGHSWALLHVQTLSAPAHSLFRSRSHAPTAPLEWLPNSSTELFIWKTSARNSVSFIEISRRSYFPEISVNR